MNIQIKNLLSVVILSLVLAIQAMEKQNKRSCHSHASQSYGISVDTYQEMNEYKRILEIIKRNEAELKKAIYELMIANPIYSAKIP